MADIKNRLTQRDITIKEILELSLMEYKKKRVDDKFSRMKLDIISARLLKRKNYKYNLQDKKWEQTGRDVKLEFIVKSDPISYKKTDSLKIHAYPITFLFHDIDKEFLSPFKWRTGSLFRPRFAPKGSTKEQRDKITLYNLKKGIQLQFFFNLEFVLKKYNLLYGVNWTNRPPVITNPKLIPYLDKHALFICKKILPHVFKNRDKLLNKSYKNV